MNILPKKSWHVRNKDNVARVRRDEAQAAEEEREVQRRVERAEQEARTDFLRQKSRALLQQPGGPRGADGPDQSTGLIEHLNLFPLEDSAEKKGNEDYLKDKKEEQERQERAIGLLVSLGPQPGTEVTPWYMKTSREKEEEKKDGKDKREKEEKRDKGKRPAISQEEKEKRDRRLKDSLDPLKDMKKALAIKDRKEHKSKKEKKFGGEKTSSGPSSIERLRAERLQREAEEKRRAQAVLDRRNGVGQAKEPEKEVEERDRPYNSGFFPELARKRQRRDRDSWRDGLI